MSIQIFKSACSAIGDRLDTLASSHPATADTLAVALIVMSSCGAVTWGTLFVLGLYSGAYSLAARVKRAFSDGHLPVGHEAARLIELLDTAVPLSGAARGSVGVWVHIDFLCDTRTVYPFVSRVSICVSNTRHAYVYYSSKATWNDPPAETCVNGRFNRRELRLLGRSARLAKRCLDSAKAASTDDLLNRSVANNDLLIKTGKQ